MCLSSLEEGDSVLYKWWLYHFKWKHDVILCNLEIEESDVIERSNMNKYWVTVGNYLCNLPLYSLLSDTSHSIKWFAWNRGTE